MDLNELKQLAFNWQGIAGMLAFCLVVAAGLAGYALGRIHELTKERK